MEVLQLPKPKSRAPLLWRFLSAWLACYWEPLGQTLWMTLVQRGGPGWCRRSWESKEEGEMSTVLRRRVDEGGPCGLNMLGVCMALQVKGEANFGHLDEPWMESSRRLMSCCVWSWSGCEKSATHLGCRVVLISHVFTRWFNWLKNGILRSVLKQRHHLT